MSIVISTLSFLFKQGAKFVPGVNPRVVEFVCHYISGSKAPMTLNKEERDYTHQQVIEAISNGCFNGEKGWVGCPKGSWLMHPTRGVVGGFVFKVVRHEDKIIIKCHDEWDFNYKHTGIGGARLGIPSQVPVWVLNRAKPILSKLGINLSDDGGGWHSIDEEDLVKFNSDHRFSTDWEFEEPSDLLDGWEFPWNDYLSLDEGYTYVVKDQRDMGLEIPCQVPYWENEVTFDLPEGGFYKAEKLPYRKVGDELTVSSRLSAEAKAQGWATAVHLDNRWLYVEKEPSGYEEFDDLFDIAPLPF